MPEAPLPPLNKRRLGTSGDQENAVVAQAKVESLAIFSDNAADAVAPDDNEAPGGR